LSRMWEVNTGLEWGFVAIMSHFPGEDVIWKSEWRLSVAPSASLASKAVVL